MRKIAGSPQRQSPAAVGLVFTSTGLKPYGSGDVGRQLVLQHAADCL